MGLFYSKPSINEVLHSLSNKFMPSDEFLRNGNIIANEVFNVLRRQRNDVDRVIVAGSIGKKTAVNDSSDFDLVVFLNYKEPPFAVVLNEIKQILAESYLTGYKFIKKTSLYIAFEVRGYKFDLAPAANYRGWFCNQYDGTFKKISELKNPIGDGFMLSPGLAESAVDFIKRQSPFVHAVLRLAKHWNSTISFNVHIRGRSLMIELLAINACRTVGVNNLYLAFKQFLTDVQNFSHLKIYFQEKSQIPKTIRNYKGPIILDPINHYNNLGNRRNISKQAVIFFEDSARKSLFELDRWINDPHVTTYAFELNIFTASQIMPPRMPCQKSKKSTMETYPSNNYGQKKSTMETYPSNNYGQSTHDRYVEWSDDGRWSNSGSDEY